VTNRIITIDDIDNDDEHKKEYIKDIDAECGNCPRKRACKIKKALRSAWIEISLAIETAGMGILYFFGKMIYPFVNLYYKHHDGMECQWCHAFLQRSNEIEYCTHCGKPWIKGFKT
jgi:hypothetical protein